MTPFLEKLQALCEQCPPDVGEWSVDGLSFEIKNNKQFEVYLKGFFKGSLRTFIRQLHFYGFSKHDLSPTLWRFSHDNFTKNNQEDVRKIVRKSAPSKASAHSTSTSASDFGSGVSPGVPTVFENHGTRQSGKTLGSKRTCSQSEDLDRIREDLSDLRQTMASTVQVLNNRLDWVRSSFIPNLSTSTSNSRSGTRENENYQTPSGSQVTTDAKSVLLSTQSQMLDERPWAPEFRNAPLTTVGQEEGSLALDTLDPDDIEYLSPTNTNKRPKRDENNWS